MLRKILIGLGALLSVVLVVVAWAWWTVGQIAVQRVTDDLYMMTGVGGNVGVLVTGNGVVVVDTMTFARQGDAIRARIREITDKPVSIVINTHYHMDHTHGNPAFPPGTKVIATDNTLKHLRERDADYWRDAPARDLLPNDTFETERELTVGGKTIRLFHPGRGHTDGDLVVEFVAEHTIHTGDLYFNGRFPNIDLDSGGSVKEWDATLAAVAARDFERVIPGHGDLSDRAGLLRFQEFMRAVWSGTKADVDRGGTLADAQQVDLSRFDMHTIWFAPYLNQNFVVKRAYEEATGKKQ
ncbi:MAG: MBL fold metallo-hydrolase [Deltaproteobacteria bacterium]|nr:MBL fold metallo-hydrolase [Deltaproteobacteria bacterium]MBI3386444.1 MBL fold metallo-hydrolase [Deltaproteobacteria bacterium]